MNGDASRQLRIAVTLANLREFTDPRGHFLIDALEDYIEDERKTSNLALALLRVSADNDGPDLGGYEPGDPKAWVLKEREQ